MGNRDDDDQRARAGGYAAGVRRQNEEREQEESRSRGIMDFLKGLWNNFGLFEMLLVLFVVGALYMAARANPQMVEGLVKHLPDDWQPTVLGALDAMGIPVNMKKMLIDMPNDTFVEEFAKNTKLSKEIVRDIIPTKAAKDELVNLVAAANGGRVSLDFFTNDKTLFALMTNKPDVVQKLATALIKPGEGDALPDSAKKIVASLKEIVKGPRLDVLFDATNRDNTIALIKKIAPTITDDKIRIMLNHGLTDGKPNALMRESLLAVLTLDANGKFGNPETAIVAAAARTPESAKALLDAVIAGLPTPQAQAVAALREKIGDDVMRELINAIQGEGKSSADKIKAVLDIALKPENLHALPQFIAVANNTPEIAADLAKLPVKLGALQQFIETTGIAADGKPSAALTELLTAIRTANKLDADTLLKPLTNYMLSADVAPKEASAPAIQKLLASIDTKDLSPKQIAQIKALQRDLTPVRLKALGAIHANGIDPLKLQEKYIDADGNPIQTRVAVQMLLINENRAELQKAGTENLAALIGDKAPLLNKKNLDTAITFTNAIITNPDNGGENAARTTRVVDALVSLASGIAPKEAAGVLTAKELSGFFQSPRNHDAFFHLLDRTKGADDKPKGLDTTALPEKQRERLTALFDNIGNFKTGEGLTSVLRDEKSAATVLELMRAGKPGWFASLFADSELAQTFIIANQANPVLDKNAKVIKNLIPFLRDVTVSNEDPAPQVQVTPRVDSMRRVQPLVAPAH